MAKCVLVTGGAGYIGSHTVVEMINGGYDVVVIDNFVNAYSNSLVKMEEITGKKIVSYTVDISSKESLSEVFSKHKFFAVVHMAAYKAVGESVKTPLRYFRNNFIGSINLLECMQENGVHNFIFSSSATVYGTHQYLPFDEDHPSGIGITNPYARSKFFIEEVVKDLCKADKELNAILLRYFNPAGAHISGKIGENPQGTPKNLLAYVLQVAIGKLPHVNVFGNDYDTPDGTAVRDYTHVFDLSLGHLAALKKLEENCGCKIYNLGTGKGYSVLEMIKAVEKASGKSIAYKFAPRRDGDVGMCYSDASLAEKELGWKATRGLQEICTVGYYTVARGYEFYV